MNEDKQYKKILERLEKIERKLFSGSPSGEAYVVIKDLHERKCSMPPVKEVIYGPDVSAERAELLRIISKKWVNGTVLHYYFFTDNQSAEDQKKVVREAFKIWKDLGIGLEFEEVTNREEAEIRIGFLQNDGAWSYLGRDNLDIGQNERTMNFGWDLTRPGEIDTALHEIGHAMGFPHEHQNPNAGIVWNEEEVYNRLAGSPNFWSKETTFRNIIRKIPQDTVEGSEWDKDSVMHYPFSAGMIRKPEQYMTQPLIPAGGLSQKDIEMVRFFYPPMEKSFPELTPFQSQTLAIKAGEQKNFQINPDASRYYHFSTFGGSDTVMVLFEEIDGELKYYKGDDDSGTNLNAQFRIRLVKDRKYVLKIRLYYNFSAGETAVMMW